MRPAGKQASFAGVLTTAMLILLAGSPRELPRSGRAEFEGETPRPHNCRFWGAISADLSPTLLEAELVDLPQSLENLSPSNTDGWALAYFPGEDSIPVLHRSAQIAILDPDYNSKVTEAGTLDARIVIGHVRNCTSGLCDIPNPHPFHRYKNGRHWLMGHNGTLDKDVLLRLIRPEYLDANPPEVGDSPEEWVDSELYFLYILQTLEDNNWEFAPALGQVVEWVRVLTPGDYEQLNFVMTNGVELYAYREGISLYYRYDLGWPQVGAVASRYPTQEQGSWVEMEDGQLVTFRLGSPPILHHIEDFFHHTQVAEVPPAPSRLNVFPNPFNPQTTLRWTQPEAGRTRLCVHDLSGRLVALIDEAHREAGEHTLNWIARTDRGRELPSGVYLLRLDCGPMRLSRKLVLLR